MKVAIYSLGCRVNIYESEYVEDLLKNHGYEIVPFEGDDKADIYIINTCSVTNESDKKSRKFIHQARRKNKDAIIVVMGCYSQVKYQEVIDDGYANIVLGNKDKSKILDILDEYFMNKKDIKRIYDLRNVSFFEGMCINNFDNHTRAFVKIQDGCNSFCSYCIIPYTRGRIRSKKADDVLSEVTNLVKNGYKEIVLTGIHTGRYGVDLEDMNLEKLLKMLIEIPGIYRIRLSSIEMNEITDGIMDLVRKSNVISSHFHIPIQSGSDTILKSMNRKYLVNDFINKINKIRELRDDISVTTDLIVGFPGETDELFNETVETLKKIKFTKIHTFPYSMRDGTAASNMSNQVLGNIKKDRVRQVLKMSSMYEKEYYSSFVGKVMEGVTEVKKDGSILVHTSNFIPVIISSSVKNNEIVKVVIDKVMDDGTVYGEIVC